MNREYMKYVNGTVELCCGVQTLASGSVGAYLNTFDTIEADADGNGDLLTPPFVAVVRINVIGSADAEAQKENPIHLKQTLGFRLNLTKCQKDPEGKNNSRVLDLFELDLGKVKLDQACFPYVNYTQIVRVKPLRLPGDHGGYAVKLLTRVMNPGEDLQAMRNSDDFDVRAIASLYFKKRAGSAACMASLTNGGTVQGVHGAQGVNAVNAV